MNMQIVFTLRQKEAKAGILAVRFEDIESCH